MLLLKAALLNSVQNTPEQTPSLQVVLQWQPRSSLRPSDIEAGGTQALLAGEPSQPAAGAALVPTDAVQGAPSALLRRSPRRHRSEELLRHLNS